MVYVPYLDGATLMSAEPPSDLSSRQSGGDKGLVRPTSPRRFASKRLGTPANFRAGPDCRRSEMRWAGSQAGLAEITVSLPTNRQQQ